MGSVEPTHGSPIPRIGILSPKSIKNYQEFRRYLDPVVRDRQVHLVMFEHYGMDVLVEYYAIANGIPYTRLCRPLKVAAADRLLIDHCTEIVLVERFATKRMAAAWNWATENGVKIWPADLRKKRGLVDNPRWLMRLRERSLV